MLIDYGIFISTTDLGVDARFVPRIGGGMELFYSYIRLTRMLSD